MSKRHSPWYMRKTAGRPRCCVSPWWLLAGHAVLNLAPGENGRTVRDRPETITGRISASRDLRLPLLELPEPITPAILARLNGTVALEGSPRSSETNVAPRRRNPESRRSAAHSCSAAARRLFVRPIKTRQTRMSVVTASLTCRWDGPRPVPHTQMGRVRILRLFSAITKTKERGSMSIFGLYTGWQLFGCSSWGSRLLYGIDGWQKCATFWADLRFLKNFRDSEKNFCPVSVVFSIFRTTALLHKIVWLIWCCS